MSTLPTCANCNAETGDGDRYRFYYGRQTDHKVGFNTQTWNYQINGPEEVFICNRCLLTYSAKGAGRDSPLFWKIGMALALLAVPLGIVLWNLWPLVAIAMFLSLPVGIVFMMVAVQSRRQAAEYTRLLAVGDDNRIREVLAQHPAVADLGDRFASELWSRKNVSPAGTVFFTRSKYAALEQPK